MSWNPDHQFEQRVYVAEYALHLCDGLHSRCVVVAVGGREHHFTAEQAMAVGTVLYDMGKGL